MPIYCFRYFLHAAQNLAELFDHGIDCLDNGLQLFMRRLDMHTQVTALQALQIVAQQVNGLFQGETLGFALLEDDGVIDGDGGLVREQLDDLYMLFGWYLAILRVI